MNRWYTPLLTALALLACTATAYAAPSLTLTTPAVVKPDRPFNIVLGGNSEPTGEDTESRVILHTELNGPDCAPTESQHYERVNIAGIPTRFNAAPGPINYTDQASYEKPGTYRLCAYLFSFPFGYNADQPAQAVATTVFRVATPPKPKPKKCKKGYKRVGGKCKRVKK